MNCWKSCDISKDYGSIRLLMLSFLGSVTYFILFYVTFMDINQVQLVDFNFIIFIVSAVLIIPAHKVLHCLPIWLFRKKAQLLVKRSVHGYPNLYCRIPQALPKRLSLLSVSFPVFVVTIIATGLSFILPDEMDYFSIIGSLNFGLSVTDIIYMMLLFKAPSKAYVEDDHMSFKILVRNQI